MKRILAGMLLLAMLTGCGTRADSGRDQLTEPPPPVEMNAGSDLMEDIASRPVDADDSARAEARPITDMGVGLLQTCFQGENVLVSPLSVTEALAMAANGADGETLEQMERVFGMDLEALNACLHSYREGLPAGEGGSVHLANGVWLNGDSGLKVRREFLQANADWYGAGAYEVPFDSGAKDAINAWVADNTKGRIDGIIDELSPGAVMVLANALAFDGVWEDVYREDQVRDGMFTDESGQARPAELMCSTEQVLLRDENATGFMKYYEGRGYAFAALLPDEGTTLAGYIASLTGERLQAVLDGADGSAYVDAAIPRFSAETGTDLTGALAKMGMPDAFDGTRADFSRMAEQAEGRLYVDRVLHKTFIRVDERGTEAGAATAVELREAGLMGPEVPVHLDRPFLYMLIDCEHRAPLFIGAVTDIG